MLYFSNFLPFYSSLPPFHSYVLIVYSSLLSFPLFCLSPILFGPFLAFSLFSVSHSTPFLFRPPLSRFQCQWPWWVPRWSRRNRCSRSFSSRCFPPSSSRPCSSSSRLLCYSRYTHTHTRSHLNAYTPRQIFRHKPSDACRRTHD